MWQEFKGFLLKQNALALAIGVVVGTALNQVVDAIVKGLIMPIVALVSPGSASWQDSLAFTVRGSQFHPGQVLSASLNFFIVGFVAWRLSKLFIRPAPEPAKAATKVCPFCRMADLDLAAIRCPHCTSEVAEAMERR